MPAPEILFTVVFLTVVGFFVVRFVKYGGRVIRTLGDVEVLRYGSTKSVIRALLLEDGRIVLEQSSRAMLAASMSGIPMAPSDADQLIHFLQQARANPTP
jgi:hypothetical protein